MILPRQHPQAPCRALHDASQLAGLIRQARDHGLSAPPALGFNLSPSSKAPLWQGDRGCPCSTSVVRAVAQMTAQQGMPPWPQPVAHTVRRQKGYINTTAGCSEHTTAQGPCQGGSDSAEVQNTAKLSWQVRLCCVLRAPNPCTDSAPLSGAGTCVP